MALDTTLNFFTYEQLTNYSYKTIDGTKYFSVKTTLTYDTDKIGLPPLNICNVEFETTDSIEEWECRATLADHPFGIGIGILVQNGQIVAGNTPKKFNITSNQLTLGNGDYRITIYVMKENIWYGGK